MSEPERCIVLHCFILNLMIKKTKNRIILKYLHIKISYQSQFLSNHSINSYILFCYCFGKCFLSFFQYFKTLFFFYQTIFRLPVYKTVIKDISFQIDIQILKPFFNSDYASLAIRVPYLKDFMMLAQIGYQLTVKHCP